MKASNSLVKASKFVFGAFLAAVFVVASVYRGHGKNKGKERMACMRNHPSGKAKVKS